MLLMSTRVKNHGQLESHEFDFFLICMSCSYNTDLLELVQFYFQSDTGILVMKDKFLKNMSNIVPFLISQSFKPYL